MNCTHTSDIVATSSLPALMDLPLQQSFASSSIVGELVCKKLMMISDGLGQIVWRRLLLNPITLRCSLVLTLDMATPIMPLNEQ